LAACAMRQILVDHARARSSAKRGGPYSITGLTEEIGIATGVVDIVALDEALTALSQFDRRAGQLVEWHVFGGLEIADIAQLQGVTPRTAFRDWRRARAFLADRLGREEAQG
ncbi:MAG: RNA polymerase subunit sigma-70, partial [Gammaproteobacteria bacterium]